MRRAGSSEALRPRRCRIRSACRGRHSKGISGSTNTNLGDLQVEKFLDAVMSHVGAGGLFEGFDCLFVDWSLSNEKFSLYPISIPVNTNDLLRAPPCPLLLISKRNGGLLYDNK